MKLATVILAMIRMLLEFMQSNTSIQNNIAIEDTTIEETIIEETTIEDTTIDDTTIEETSIEESIVEDVIEEPINVEDNTTIEDSTPIEDNTTTDDSTSIEYDNIEEASNSAKGYLFSIQNAEQGNYGVLYIPSIETHVKLNTSEYKYWQYTVDNEDSALFFSVCNADVIADHVNQSFANLKYVNIGDELQIMNGDRLFTYKCVLNSKGYNTSVNGRPGLYFTDYSDAYYYGGLTLYTCLDASGKNVTITHWDKIN